MTAKRDVAFFRSGGNGMNPYAFTRNTSKPHAIFFVWNIRTLKGVIRQWCAVSSRQECVTVGTLWWEFEVAWCYHDALEMAAPLQGRVAFYPSKVTIEEQPLSGEVAAR